LHWLQEDGLQQINFLMANEGVCEAVKSEKAVFYPAGGAEGRPKYQDRRTGAIKTT